MTHTPAADMPSSFPFSRPREPCAVVSHRLYWPCAEWGMRKGRQTGDAMPARYDGLLVLDKPPGMTSRAALDRALRWFPRGTRMGHTGTLDPLATGVLVVCLGCATRLAEHVQRMAKTY